jgi:hypothetical protein
VVNKAGSKTLVPVFSDEIEIYDGSTKIFGGTISNVEQVPLTQAGGIQYSVNCVDHTNTMNRILASKIYSNETIENIIADLITSYAPTFTTNNVASTFVIQKITFNQVTISECIKKLADVVNYDWYVDEEKDVHFFDKYSNSAPFSLTDSNGNYIYSSIKRNADGSQMANRVKVRGGEYNGDTFTDVITVSGNASTSFKLPYRFANLTVEVDTGAGYISKTVGIDFIDAFPAKDVLFNFQEKIIRFENALSDGNKIRFSGNPKVPVFAIAEDPDSIIAYGVFEKLIRDTSISSNEVARKRASAELYSYSEPVIDAKFSTYTSGLRAGMVVNIQSTIQGVDEQLIIKSLTFKMREHDSFSYSADLVSTKRYDFITLLQKMLQPEPRSSDEQEVSEQIFTDTQTIQIQEEIEYVVAVEDTAQTITTQENYMLDPLGDETDAEYVLAPYVPTSQTDTKRPGRLDISLVAY